MKNVVSKVLMMFVMSFTLLFTCSYAEFNTIPKDSSDQLQDEVISASLFTNNFFEDTGYSVTQVKNILNYKDSINSSEVDTYVSVMNLLSEKGYAVFTGTGYYNYFIFKVSSGFDFGKCTDLTYFLNIGDTFYRNGSREVANSVIASGYSFTSVSNFICHNARVKNLSSDFTWTEEKGYYFEPTLCNAVGDVSTSDTPSNNHDLAGLISAITSSDVIKDNTDSTSREYFIIPYGSINGKPLYDVYFYNSRLNLSAFEYLMNDNNLYYDLDKVSVDGVIANIIDFFGGLRGDNDFLSKLHYFTLLYDSELGTVDVSYNGKVSFEGNDMCGFSSEQNPIIYTTKNIILHRAPLYSF